MNYLAKDWFKCLPEEFQKEALKLTELSILNMDFETLNQAIIGGFDWTRSKDMNAWIGIHDWAKTELGREYANKKIQKLATKITMYHSIHKPEVAVHINGRWAATIMNQENEGKYYEGYKITGHKASLFLATCNGLWKTAEGKVVGGYLYFKPNNKHTKKKSTLEWLKILPSTIMEKAIINTILLDGTSGFEGEHYSFEEAINGAFVWSDSLEGHEFWSQVAIKYTTPQNSDSTNIVTTFPMSSENNNLYINNALVGKIWHYISLDSVEGSWYTQDGEKIVGNLYFTDKSH